jgi:PHP family Zn ribbon phosphoesterase
MHEWEIDKSKVREVAEKHGLLLLSNSDAHYVSDIGRYYNEISLEELYARVK